MAQIASTRFLPAELRTNDICGWHMLSYQFAESEFVHDDTMTDTERKQATTVDREIRSADSVLELRRLKTRERVRRFRARKLQKNR